MTSPFTSKKGTSPFSSKKKPSPFSLAEEDEDDEEDEAPVKLKSRALVVPKKKAIRVIEEEDEEEPEDDEQSTAKIQIEKAKATLSTFGVQSSEIQSLLKADENDTANQLIQKRILMMLVDLLPVAEEKVRASETTKGIYQLTNLVSQIREMMAEMQVTRDEGELVSRICQGYLMPAFLGLGQSLAEFNTRLKESLRTIVPEDRTRSMEQRIDEFTRNFAEYATLTYRDVSAKIENALTDDEG